MEDQFQPGKAEQGGLSIKEMFFKYIRFLPLFIISVALSLLGAYIYLRYATPVYSSSGGLIVKSDKGQSNSGGDRFQQLFVLDNSINIQNEIEVLRSRPLMERVVESLNLNFEYLVKGKIKESNIYKLAPFMVQAIKINDSSRITPLKIDFINDGSFRINGDSRIIAFGQAFAVDNGTFRLIRKPGQLSAEYIITWSPTWAVAGQLASGINVMPKGTTGNLGISLEAAHPQLAADVINQLMIEYQEMTIEDKNETTRNTLDFIDDRLRIVQFEVDSVQAEIQAFRMANDITDVEAQTERYISRQTLSEDEIKLQRRQLLSINLLSDFLRNKRNEFDVVLTTYGINDPTLVELIAAYNAAQMARKQVLVDVPVTSPYVTQRTEQIEVLRRNILTVLSTLRNTAANTIGTLETERQSFASKISSLPQKEQQMVDMNKGLETKQEVLNFLLEKREESAISLAATISNIKVVEQANPNGTPVKPNRRNIQLIAFVIGLALPALGIFVAELLNDRVTTRHDVEKITNATILGEVGHSFANENLVVKSNNRGIVAEQFRIIRSNLQYVLNNIKKPVILVTSSFSGEGKSFISTNMGAVMALAGKRTVVLEFDIRKPKILSHLNIPKKPGLINYILGKAELDDLPIPVPGYDNLFVLACGPVPPNPAELLLDPKMNQLFDYLRANFDVVVMDTAPVGMVSDALTLSKYADTTLYIVRQGHTYKKLIGLVDEFYTQGKLPRISLILNDVKLKSGYGYYGYGRYGYGYGYGSGYFDDEEQPTNGFLSRWLGWADLNKKSKKKSKKEKV